MSCHLYHKHTHFRTEQTVEVQDSYISQFFGQTNGRLTYLFLSSGHFPGNMQFKCWRLAVLFMCVCVWHFGMNHIHSLGIILQTNKKQENKIMYQTRELNESHIAQCSSIESACHLESCFLLQPQAVRLYQKLFIKEIQFDYLCSW